MTSLLVLHKIMHASHSPPAHRYVRRTVIPATGKGRAHGRGTDRAVGLPDDDAGVIARRAEFAAPGESLGVGAQVLSHGQNRVRQT